MPRSRPARAGDRLMAMAMAALVCALPALAATPLGETAFPQLRPATPDQAIQFLRLHGAADGGCLTAAMQGLSSRRPGAPLLDRAIGVLQHRVSIAGESTIQGPDGIVVRWVAEPTSLDRIDPTDTDDDGIPDAVAAALDGLAAARTLFVDRLGMGAPDGLDVALLPLDGVSDGFLVASPDRPGGLTAAIEAAPSSGGTGIRAAAIHQYAHAVALRSAPGIPAGWAEALATWAVLTAEGVTDPAMAASLSRRIDGLNRGLFADDPQLAPGNALWLAFLDEAYGPAAVRLTVEELGRGAAPSVALDVGVRSVSQDGLAAAFREFQLWTVLVGQRSDGRHFPFADRLPTPHFATTADGLPALLVQAGPPVAAFGATAVRLRPDSEDGGLRLRVEGDFAALWEADLLLRGDRGRLQRVPIDLSDEGRGEVTVPLDGLDEAWLLLRSLGNDDGDSHRYTWAAHRERGFPFELSTIDAVSLDDDRPGVRVRWTTASERRLIGYNVLRVPEGGGTPIVVNPVWIPALGDTSTATSYEFIDTSVEPGVAYEYRVVGITREGLSSASGPVAPGRAPSLDRP